MKINILLVLLIGIALSLNASEYEFLPPVNAKLSLAFEGETQSAKEIHKLEIRQLGYSVSGQSIKRPSSYYYLIYYAGDEYGPEILTKLKGHSPFMKLSEDQATVEIEFTRGNNGHTLQIWKLTGYSAEFQEEKPITWKERRHLDK
jgi:hypothetical protein